MCARENIVYNKIISIRILTRINRNIQLSNAILQRYLIGRLPLKMSEERFQEKKYVLVYTPSDKTGYCIMLVYASLLI